MNRFKSSALAITCICVGLGIISAPFSGEETHGIGAIIFSIVMGLICLLVGFGLLYMECIPAWKNRERTLQDDVNEFLRQNQTGKDDENEDDELISDFRKSYCEFFSETGIKENFVIQNTATQLYWHMMYLQKLRMDRKKYPLILMQKEKLMTDSL